MTWPLLMSEATAAKACDMSQAAFVRAVEAGQLPQPVIMGKNKRRASWAIQKHVDGMAGDDVAPYRREFLEKIERAA